MSGSHRTVACLDNRGYVDSRPPEDRSVSRVFIRLWK